jgi:predicted O-methyltransferase YrrM
VTPVGQLLDLDEAILRLRRDPACANPRPRRVSRPRTSARRPCVSRSRRSSRKCLTLLGRSVQGATLLDVGAGTGVAAAAFASAGVARVYALEPDGRTKSAGYSRSRR